MLVSANVATVAGAVMVASLAISCSQDKQKNDDGRRGDNSGDAGGHREPESPPPDPGVYASAALVFTGTNGDSDCRVSVKLVPLEDAGETSHQHKFQVRFLEETADGHNLASVEGQFYNYNSSEDVYVRHDRFTGTEGENALAGMVVKPGVGETDINRYQGLMEENQVKEIMRLDFNAGYSAEQIVEGFELLMREGATIPAELSFNPFIYGLFVSLHVDHYHSEVCEGLVLTEIAR